MKKNLNVTVNTEIIEKLMEVSILMGGNLSKTVNDLLCAGLSKEAVELMILKYEAQQMHLKEKILQ